MNSQRSIPGATNNPHADRHGHLFVMSAPSGAGKSTLCRAILQKMPDLKYSISSTTRNPRAGEIDGVDYHFIDREAFRAGIDAGEWIEWAEVHGNFYGTSAVFIAKGLSNGDDILLDIDVQGAAQIVSRFPDSITIFVMPPSMDELSRRLAERGTDDPAIVKTRLVNAEREIRERHRYRHIVVNDSLDEAVDELVKLIHAYRAHR